MSISNKTLAFCIGFASSAHSRQFDKRGLPYILHPIAVMEKVKVLVADARRLNNGYSLDMNLAMSVAIMHDVFEDIKGSAEDFFLLGKVEELDYNELALVSQQVTWLTHDNGIEYDAYVDRMIANARTESLLVKMADMEHNSDMKRIIGADQKDVDRIAKYMRNYLKIKNNLGI